MRAEPELRRNRALSKEQASAPAVWFGNTSAGCRDFTDCLSATDCRRSVICPPAAADDAGTCAVCGAGSEAFPSNAAFSLDLTFSSSLAVSCGRATRQHQRENLFLRFSHKHGNRGREIDVLGLRVAFLFGLAGVCLGRSSLGRASGLLVLLLILLLALLSGELAGLLRTSLLRTALLLREFALEIRLPVRCTSGLGIPGAGSFGVRCRGSGWRRRHVRRGADILHTCCGHEFAACNASSRPHTCPTVPSVRNESVSAIPGNRWTAQERGESSEVQRIPSGS